MRKRFHDKGLNASAKLGGLFCYDIQVKEGYMFDTLNWKLIGSLILVQKKGIWMVCCMDMILKIREIMV